jgi:hypothetical protein
VSNNSGNAPQDVQLSDGLPPGATAVSASSSAGKCATTPQLRCDLGSIHRGANVTVTIVAKLTAVGANVNQVHVQSELPDSNMANDTAQFTTTVAAPPGGGGGGGTGPP